MTIDDRIQIHDALLSYCRGVDRLDVHFISAAFHPGAELDYGNGPVTTIEEWAPRAVELLRTAFEVTQHRISNTTIEVVGAGRANVETYVLSFHVQAGHLLTFNGRYLDRFERRDGHWRIVKRVLRHDWSLRQPMTGDMGMTFTDSARDKSDLIYRW